MKLKEAPKLRALDLALRDQVIQEFLEYIRGCDGQDRIGAARTVMRLIIPSEETMQPVEISAVFVRVLLKEMIAFIRDLIRDYVSILSATETENRASLGQRVEELKVHANPVVSELEECDSYLRSLRALQADMDRLNEINSGVTETGISTERTSSFTATGFSSGTSAEWMVEKSLLTGTPCMGIFGLTRGHTVLQSGRMRALARLIAYSFISSASIDSFFAGIHILRNSGHHVQSVLTAFYRDTSVRFVRERLACHLAHWGFQPSACVQRMQELYPNNCYVTELSRCWAARTTAALAGHVTATSTKPPSTTSQVRCGNVADVAVGQELSSMGQIGAMSADDAQSVLRCSLCQETRGVVIQAPVDGRGYLHITAAWAAKMTPAEVDRICIEQNSLVESLPPETLFHYAVSHKDWQAVATLPWSQITVPYHHGAFISRVLKETFMARNPDALSRTELASIRKLLSVTISQRPEFHHEILRWLTVERALPQLALMYLRRYGLGETVEAVNELCSAVQSPMLTFLAKGRLGNGSLAAVADLYESSEDDALRSIAEWMIRGTAPSDAVLAHITSEYPSLSPFESTAQSAPDHAADIFCVASFKQDVCIKELLGDVFPDLDLDAPLVDPVAFVRTALEEAEYLMAQGRPCAAFTVCVQASVPPGALQRSARRVAMYNLFDDGIVASAIALLDLFGESTETLRVDTHAARTILSTPSAASKRAVVDLFLSFGSLQTGSTSQLLQSLKLLEESAWAKEPPISDNGPSPPPSGAGFESPWHLVALFCRVHNLPRSLTLLHELARNGDWVMFLHESDVQQCPTETVKDVTQYYFDRTPLRSHLNILLQIDREDSAERSQAQRCAGLEHVLSGDAHAWLRKQPRTTATVYQRGSAIFEETENHQVMAQKAFSLRSFSAAKRHFDSLPEQLRADTAKSVNVENEFLQFELDRITTGVERVETQLLPAAEELAQETKEEIPETIREESLTTAIDECLNRKDFRQLRGRVTSPGQVAELVDVLSMRSPELEGWSMRWLEDLVTWVSPESLGSFGDAMAKRIEGNVMHVIAYWAYAGAFVDEAKLDDFLRTHPEVHARVTDGNDCIAQLASATGSQKLRLVDRVTGGGNVALGILADEILTETTKRSDIPDLQALGAVLKVSRVYEKIGLVNKHLESARCAIAIAERLRASSVSV